MVITVRVFLYIYYWGQVQAGYLRNGKFPRWPPPNFRRPRLGHRRSHGPSVRCSGKGKPSSFVPTGYFSVSRSRSVCHLWNGASHLGGKRATAEPFDTARRAGAQLVAQSLGYMEDFESHRNSHWKPRKSIKPVFSCCRARIRPKENIAAGPPRLTRI